VAAELGVHAQLSFVVVAPQEEPFALGDACTRIECALDLCKLAALELGGRPALEVLLRETQLVLVVRSPAENLVVDGQGQSVCNPCRHTDDFFIREFGDVARFK